MKLGGEPQGANNSLAGAPMMPQHPVPASPPRYLEDAASRPDSIDFLAYARLHNGACPQCGKIKAHDGTPRCPCLSEEGGDADE